MTKRDLSEKLLAAAKKVGIAEQALAGARAEYESLFDELLNRRNRADLAAEETPTATIVPASINGHGPLKVEQKVFKFIQEKGTAQDARSVHEGTKIPLATARWAFAKLVDKGMITKEQRGKYVIRFMERGLPEWIANK